MKTHLMWPLPGFDMEVPEGPNHPGSFGAKRKFDIHTGVDLYVPEGTNVTALEDGIVVAIEKTFTGGDDTPKRKTGEPIWLVTEAILIEGPSGVVLYGELSVDPSITVGAKVSAGMSLGKVKSVLRPKEDGKPYNNPANSASMLHVELYTFGSRKSVYWHLHEAQPTCLLDPTAMLKAARKSLK